MIEDCAQILTAFFLIWSVILLWASWRLLLFAREERRSIERWKRLRRVAESQRSRWQ
jgi:hypothetical protein